MLIVDTSEFASIGTSNGLKSKRDKRKRITISLPTSIWSHCFVGIEVNSASVYFHTEVL